MKVIAVRTDRPVYSSNVYGGGTITITATVQVDPGEAGMYKLVAYIKKEGEPANAWTRTGYEQWGSPQTTCIVPVPGIKTACGDDVQLIIPSPVGFGKHIVTVINVNEMNDTSGITIDGVVKATGAFATFEVLAMEQVSYGLLKVFSNPSAAIIIVDGLVSDRVTAAGASQDFALPAGKHSVTVAKMGYESFMQDVIVVAREAVQVYAKLVPKRSMTGAGTAFAAWGGDFNVGSPLVSPQPANPLYKPYPNSGMTGRSYAVTGTDPIQTAIESLGNVANTIAQYTPYILLAGGGAVLIYALSKPSIRKKATEYAARGGVAARAGLGGMKDVARAGYRGIKSKRVEEASHEDIEQFLKEAAAKRAYPHMTRKEADLAVNVPESVRERAEERLTRVNGVHMNGRELDRISEFAHGSFMPTKKQRKIMLTLED